MASDTEGLEVEVINLVCDTLDISEEGRTVRNGCLKRQYPLPRSRVSTSTTLDELGVDSLDRVELTAALEEKYDLSLPDEVTECWDALGNIIRYLAKQKAAVD